MLHVYGCVEVVSAAAPRPEAGTLLADIDAILFSKKMACGKGWQVDREQRVLGVGKQGGFLHLNNPSVDE